VQLALVKHGVNSPDDAGARADADPVADFERLLTSEVPGGDQIIASAEFVTVVGHSRSRLPERSEIANDKHRQGALTMRS